MLLVTSLVSPVEYSSCDRYCSIRSVICVKEVTAADSAVKHMPDLGQPIREQMP